MGKKAEKKMYKELLAAAQIHLDTYRIGLLRAVEEAVKEFNGDLADADNQMKVFNTFCDKVGREARIQEEMVKFGRGGLPRE